MFSTIPNCRLLAISLFFSISLCAQDTFPKNYFIDPLDIPISLAGTFGEIRTDHYHTGIDIRTDGKEGLPVHAVADGYVSRIAVSPYGYGNALYITHPNGYISLYGHLSRYNNVIMKYIREKQYEQEKYALDINLNPYEIPVKQVDTIAFSGSTGAAEGPHLHFELRRVTNENAINPLLFGYTITDHLPPLIISISIYPLNDTSNINGKHEALYLKAVKKQGKGYQLIDSSPIHAYGSIGIGLNCYDIAENIESKNGPYTKVLKDNNDTIYFSRMDELSFATIHYINGHIDYPAMRERNEPIEFSFLQDNDRLNIYKKLVNKGRLNIPSSGEEKGIGVTHKLEYAISDFNGNTSTLNFTIQSGMNSGQSSSNHQIIKLSNYQIDEVHWNKPFEYSANGMKIEIPANALFKDMNFHYSIDTSYSSHTQISPVYKIQDENTPLNTNYTLMIKPKPDLPDSLMKKAVMVRIEGKQWASVGGKWENGYFIAHPKRFGSYAVMLDLYRPVIKPLNIYKGKNMAKDSEIEFEISDNLSGISSFNAYVDGKWILVELNPKKNLYYYTFDEHVPPGAHQLKLVVTDEVGNTNVYKTEFTR